MCNYKMSGVMVLKIDIHPIITRHHVNDKRTRTSKIIARVEVIQKNSSLTDNTR